jgi:hypothetical protein
VSHSCGNILTFDYSGSVALGGGTVFGIPIGDAVPVAGQLVVDKTATMTHDLGNGRLGYRQVIPTGFTATFGSGQDSVDVDSGEYLVVIGNNVDLVFDINDTVEFLFATDLLPTLSTPLVVEGVPREQGDYNGDGSTDDLDYTAWRAQFGMSGGLADGNGNATVDAADYVLWRDGRLASYPVGFFSINFIGGSELLSSSVLADADLATKLNPTNFLSLFNPLGDVVNMPDVFFDLSTFSLRVSSAFQVPEPGGLFILLSSGLIILSRRRRAPVGRAFS